MSEPLVPPAPTEPEPLPRPDLADKLLRLARLAAAELRREDWDMADCWNALSELEDAVEEALAEVDTEIPDHVLAATSGGCFP